MKLTTVILLRLGVFFRKVANPAGSAKLGISIVKSGRVDIGSALKAGINSSHLLLRFWYLVFQSESVSLASSVCCVPQRLRYISFLTAVRCRRRSLSPQDL